MPLAVWTVPAYALPAFVYVVRGPAGVLQLSLMINEQDLRRVAAESMVTLSVARKAYAGGRVRPGVRLRLELAAQKIGVVAPPPPAELSA